MNDDNAPFINRVNAKQAPIIEAENERRALEIELLAQRNRLTRTTVAAVIAVLVLLGWFFRLEVVANPSGSPPMYTHNRITGEIRVLYGDESHPVKVEK